MAFQQIIVGWNTNLSSSFPTDFIYLLFSTRTGPNTWTPRQALYSTVGTDWGYPPGFDPTVGESFAYTCGSQDSPTQPHIGLLVGLTNFLPPPDDSQGVAFAVPETPTPPTPTAVDSVNKPALDVSFTGATNQGAWLFGNFYWMIGTVLDPLSQIERIRVYRSPDRVTWTGVDTANEIVPSAIYQTGNCWGVDLTAGKIHFCYVDFSGGVNALKLQLKEFDFTLNGGLGAWTAAHDPMNFTNPTAPGVMMAGYSPSTGIFHVAISGTQTLPIAGTVNGVYYYYFSGGSWHIPETHLTAFAPGNAIYFLMIDPDGTTVHFVGGAFGDQYQQVRAGGVLGPSATFPLAPSGAHAGALGKGIIANGQMNIPTAWNTSGRINLPALWVSDQLANPSFGSAPEIIDSTPDEVDTEEMIAYFVPAPPNPIITSTTSGGRGFIKFTLNAFTGCLARDFILYELIDRTLLSCAKRPECFCFDERQWGEEAEEVPPMGPPYGAIDFNPAGQIALPLPGADTLIFSFRVPTGYDGIILGFYHSFTGTGFLEGSGDIVWRIRSDQRYLRDCGNMKVTMGSSRQLSTVQGGLQLWSNDFVEYLVNAPNTSGLLGVGNILAGAHGYFWPRL